MILTRLRLTAAAVTILLAAGLGAVVAATPASACYPDDDGDCYRSVQGTVTSANLNVRAAPWGTVIDNVPNGYKNTVDCYVQASDGSYWDWLYDTRIGRSGWVYDPYLYTGGNIYQQVDEMHEGNCGTIPLTMPGNVRAVATGSGRIHVSWSDTNSGAANYVISNGNVSTADLPTGSTGYDWSGLAPGTYMCFTVAAKESGQQSPWTAYACTTTWSLSTPTNVHVSASYGSGMHVTWTDTDGGSAQFVVTNGNSSSADLPAGATSYDWTGMAPGTYMCFAVAAKQSGQQSAWSPWTCTTTWAYVNLGDSFSSGEGTYAYQSGSDTSTDKCHRSDKSYSGQFASVSTRWKGVTTNIACSGAVTYDLGNPIAGANNEMNVPAAGEPAQLSKLNAGTGLVTFSIGGNNLDLADLFQNCIMLHDHDKTDACFHNTFSDAFINNIPTMLENGNGYGPGLGQTYTDINNAAPNAQVVVSTYPQIFPTTYTGDYKELAYWPLQVYIYVITSQDQLDRIHRVTAAINATIRSEAHAHGFLILDEENAFSGHEVGTGSGSYVNDVQGFTVDAGGNLTHPANNESLHPNQSGYQRWGNDLKALLG
jgi:hypothetical protein